MLTSTSFGSNPTELNTKVSGNFAEVEIEKAPLSSVYVPVEVPLITIDTAGTPSFEVELRTVPLMVTVCAKA